MRIENLNSENILTKRIFFLCSQNKLRSPTAEAIFSDLPGLEVDSAGLNNDAVTRLSPEQLDWADTILVMETSHLKRLNQKFRQHLKGKKIAVLNIPDDYGYMDEDLIALLSVRCRPYIPST